MDTTKHNTNMLLVTSSWLNQKTFKMIPLTPHCPYNECIFDPRSQSLAIISKEKKENYHMLPKINEWGDALEAKPGKRTSGKPYAEQRVALETYYEYYLEDQAEIEAFIKMFAANEADYSYQPILEAAFAPATPVAEPVEA